MNEGQKAVSLQRRAYEIEQGIRDENGEENGGRDNDFDDLEEDEKFEMVNAVSGKVNTDAPTSSSVPFMPAPIPEGLSPIEKAKLLAAQMMAQGRSAPPTIESTLPPLPVSGPIDTQAALARAKLLAATLVSKPLHSSAESANPSGTASEGHFAGELEINDYPIEARKKATHRNTLDDIAERTGVNVISRGQYIDPTKPAKFGERKLYLLLEGTSELQVRQAKMEIKHILEEETLKLGSAISSGRYSVV